jgi:DNA-binding SARP family transcriptional activator
VAEFRVLGPFEVVVDGKAVPLGGPQPRAAHALLVFRTNRVVATDTIVEALWSEAVPGSAVAVVRTYIARLRRALSVVNTVRLVSKPPGYLLELDREQVDTSPGSPTATTPTDGTR